ncbi:MAG: transaldolase [Pseudomonadota bacterium]
MRTTSELKIKLYADGADKAGMLEMYRNPLVKGFTTNPTLMRKAGITNYQAFALDILKAIPDRPISFEVFADEFNEMEEQAHQIASWSENVMVKIPITNTRGQSAAPLIKRLSAAGIRMNITALLTLAQVEDVARVLAKNTPAYVSVFAGRIADTGIDPLPMMQQSLELLSDLPRAELLWASPRELLNVYQANDMGCQIITATNDILSKLSLVGKDLTEYSLDTVKMFYRDATAAGYSIATEREPLEA